SAWVTDAPLSMAILVAVVSCPFRVPTMRSRMICSYCIPCVARGIRASGALRLDDFGHGDAELVLDEDDFAARDQSVIDINVDSLAGPAVEFENGAGAGFQEFADVHL